MQGLTKRQEQTLDFIRSSIESRGYPPTLREIGEHMGIRSTNGVNDHLRALERKGYLRREDMKSRALKLVEDMSAPWDAKQFKDTYREDLLKRVEEKARKGQSHTLTRPGREKPERRSAEIVDLTALLRRSLEEKSQRPAGGTARRRASRPAGRTRRRA